MKTLQKIIHFIFIGILFIALSNTFVLAQNKPKGKEWKVPDADAKKKSAIKADDAAIKAGKDIWVQQCKSCHGSKGLGDGAKADKIDISCGDFSSAEVQNLSDGALYWKITQGRKPMPAFSDKLSDNERWQVVAFMRTLKKGGATTTTSTTTTNTTTTTTKTTDSNPVKKDDTSVKKDTVSTTVVVKTETLIKSDTTKIMFYQYQQLQAEIELLKKQMAELKAKMEAIKEEKDKK